MTQTRKENEMLYGGHRRADIPESEYRFYKLIMTRLEYAMDEHRENADVLRVLDYVRYGARHGDVPGIFIEIIEESEYENN